MLFVLLEITIAGELFMRARVIVYRYYCFNNCSWFFMFSLVILFYTYVNSGLFNIILFQKYTTEFHLQSFPIQIESGSLVRISILRHWYTLREGTINHSTDWNEDGKHDYSIVTSWSLWLFTKVYLFFALFVNNEKLFIKR